MLSFFNVSVIPICRYFQSLISPIFSPAHFQQVITIAIPPSFWCVPLITISALRYFEQIRALQYPLSTIWCWSKSLTPAQSLSIQSTQSFQPPWLGVGRFQIVWTATPHRWVHLVFQKCSGLNLSYVWAGYSTYQQTKKLLVHLF